MPFDLTSLIGSSSSQLVLLAFIFIILKRNGINVLELLKNGKNGNGNHTNADIEALQAQIASLQDNHLNDLSQKIDRLIEKEDAGNLIAKEILITLKNIKL